MLTSLTTTLKLAAPEVAGTEAGAARRPGWEPEEAASLFSALVALLLDMGRGCQGAQPAATGFLPLTGSAFDKGEAPRVEATTLPGDAAAALPALSDGLLAPPSPSLDLQAIAPPAFSPAPGLDQAASPPVSRDAPAAALSALPQGLPEAAASKLVVGERSPATPTSPPAMIARDQPLPTLAPLTPLASPASPPPADADSPADAGSTAEAGSSDALPAPEGLPSEPVPSPIAAADAAIYAVGMGGRLTPKSADPAVEPTQPDGATKAVPKQPTPPTAAPIHHRSREPNRQAAATDSSREQPAPATAEPAVRRFPEPPRADGVTDILQERPTPPEAEPVARDIRASTRTDALIDAVPEQPAPATAELIARDGRPALESLGEKIPPEPRPSGISPQPGSEVEAGEAWAALRARITELDPQRQSIRVTMDPEGLGAMQVEVSLTGDGARASFEVADPAAGQFLSNREADLRQALEDVGVRLNSVNVRLGDGSRQRETGTARPDDPAAGAPAVLPPTRAPAKPTSTRPGRGLVDYRV